MYKVINQNSTKFRGVYLYLYQQLCILVNISVIKLFSNGLVSHLYYRLVVSDAKSVALLSSLLWGVGDLSHKSLSLWSQHTVPVSLEKFLRVGGLSQNTSLPHTLCWLFHSSSLPGNSLANHNTQSSRFMHANLDTKLAYPGQVAV